MFTEKELKVARMRLEGFMNKEIALELNVSEADISQTINRTIKKVKTVQDSVELLMNMDVIHEGPEYMLTEKGRRLARIPERKAPKPTELGGRFWYDFEMCGVHETSKTYDLVRYIHDLYTHIAGQKHTIVVFGVCEARTSTLTERKRKTISSTLEPIQSIEALERAVLTR